MSVTEVFVNICKNAMNLSFLTVFDRIPKCLSLHACAQTCVFVCVLLCFTCVHAPRGETGCVGCYLLLQRVTANHQPWQTLGEREEREGRGKREGDVTNERERRARETDRQAERDRKKERIGIWIPLRNHRVLRILPSQPLYEFGPELDNHVASHLAHWQLINPHQYRYTPR